MNEEARKNKIYFLPFFMLFFSFFVLIKSIGSGELWRIILSSIGFLIFLTMSVLASKRFFSKKV